jgi:hypothetical protein
MDEGKLRNITELLVNCFENRMKIRPIGNSKEYECKTKEEIDSKHTVGLYTSRKDTFYSILRFHGILYLIINSGVYDIVDNKIEFSFLTKDDDYRIFTVAVNDDIIHTIEYSRIKAIEDNWSSEDDLDFFAWISNIYEKGRLDNILR